MSVRSMSIRTMLSCILRATAVLACSLIILAIPAQTRADTSVGLAAFGGATSINFSGFTNDTAITNQFSAQGITVSGGLFEDVGGPSAVIFGANAASNFLPSNPGPAPYNTIVLTFSTPMLLVGVNEISNPGNFNFTDANGTVAHASSLRPSFAGFEDPSGFRSVTLTVTGATNNAFGIDSLLFTPVSAVPEPASLLLLGTGLAAVVAVKRRKRLD